MSDLYQQLNANREVPPRTQDGFRDPTKENEQAYEDREPISSQERSRSSIARSSSVTNSDAPNYLVETAKSKLLTLEVSLRQQLEQHLFDNPDISWDTFIESALILCFKNQSQTQRATKLAAERLVDRKRSAVYKRTQTMAKKFM